MKSFNQFVKELKSMEGLERFNWYVLKPIALMICILVVALMQDGQHKQGEQLLPFFLSSPFSKPGLVPDFKSGKYWRMLTPKIAKELNAQDRKKLQKKNKA